jgi:hypothetical protein
MSCQFFGQEFVFPSLPSMRTGSPVKGFLFILCSPPVIDDCARDVRAARMPSQDSTIHLFAHAGA